MGMRICLPFLGKKVCFDIPILVEKRFPPKPEPDPEPWLHGLDISREMIRDLSVLASMNDLGSELKTPVMRKQFAQALQGAIEHLKLPEGVHVTFDQQSAGVHS